MTIYRRPLYEWIFEGLCRSICIIDSFLFNGKKNNNYLNAYPNVREYMFIYTLRYFHFIIYLFSSFYLLFFWGIGKQFDRYVFLILALGIVIGWYIFQGCYISFLELLFYNVNTDAIKTTYNPDMFSVFDRYSSVVSYILGTFHFITLHIVLYFSKSIPLNIKVIYYILFLAFFFDAIIKGCIHTLYFDSVNNKPLRYISQFYKKYLYSPP
jgi:hypothetical protein